MLRCSVVVADVHHLHFTRCQLGFEKKKSPFTWNPDNRTIYMLDGKALSIAIDLTGKAWDAFVHAKTRPHAVKGESAVIFERRKEKGSAEEITLIWERPMVRVICRGFEFDKITQTYTAMRNLSVSPEAWEWPYVERARSSSPRHSIRALSPASRVQQGEVIAGPFTLSKSIYSVPPNAGSPLPSGTKLHYGGVIINTSGGGSVRVALQPDALQKLRQHAPKNGKRGASAKLVLSPPTKSAKAAASAPPTCALSWVSEESKNLQVGGISFHARHGAFLQSTVPGSVTATSSTLPVSQATVQGQVICQDARAGDLFTPTLEAVMSESGTFTLTKDIIKVRIGIRMDLFRILCVQYQTLPVVADRATTYTLSRSDGQLHHLTWRKSVFTYSLKMVKQNAPAAGLPYYVSDHSGDSLTGLGSGLERYLTAAL